MQLPVNEKHKRISKCYSGSPVVSGSERQRDTSEPHSSSLLIFEREGLKGTKGSEPKPERQLWRIPFIFVIVKGCQPACTQEPEATQTSRWAAEQCREPSWDDSEKPLILLKTWPMASFSVPVSPPDAALAPFPAVPSAEISEVNGKAPTITENTVMSFQQLTLNILFGCTFTSTAQIHAKTRSFLYS